MLTPPRFVARGYRLGRLKQRPCQVPPQAEPAFDAP